MTTNPVERADAHEPNSTPPVIIVGAGPIGLMSALGLAHYGIPFIVLETGGALSTETKAGTVLTRTIEILDRYGAARTVMRDALRVDEIGDIERATNQVSYSVRTATVAGETRFPFVLNIPQSSLEDTLFEVLDRLAPASVRFGHRVTGFTQDASGVVVEVEGPKGRYELAGSYLLGCDGGRSSIRGALGVRVEGKTLAERYMLVDLKVDLDVDNPRDYPYLAYFADPEEWMILVRQPHCWRFLFPLAEGAEVPSEDALREKALQFIGEVDEVEVIGTNVYPVHLRIADKWQSERVFLLGDAAHLITPMWALGLNTGALDASNLPWRLAWVLRGWADPSLLDGYEQEQSVVASSGSAQMAEAAREAMAHQGEAAVTPLGRWGYTMTRTMLAVKLDVDGSGDWTMTSSHDHPQPVTAGDRIPDFELFGSDGGVLRAHDLVRDSFAALHFADARRRPPIPAAGTAGLQHYIVSRWDAPLDSGFRDRALLDPGSAFRERLGVEDGTTLLVRPDGHVAAILIGSPDSSESAYRSIMRPNRTVAGDQLEDAHAR